ncbi:MAG: outer membrane beta-barrel protein [Kofleriaceae bacterium]|nr:outer membrane beta-barrel protein [Kofleriaceae bacterium]
MRVTPGVLRPSLALILALPILAAPGQAHAGGFFEIGGGIAIPMADDNWTDAVETSPKLTVKAGSVPGKVGGAVSFDWTPENTDAQGFSNGIGNADISANRFRILANLLFQVPVQKKLHFEGRAGIGVDIAHASVSGSVLGVNFDTSDTDAGLGLEVGAGMWFDVGSVQVGAQVALPIAMHNHKADNNDEITFDYTSYDFDLLFGVRFVSR